MSFQIQDEPMSDLTRASTPSSSNGNNTQTASQASSAVASQSTSSLKQELTAPKKEAAAAAAPKQPEVKREPTPPPGEDNVWSPDELRLGNTFYEWGFMENNLPDNSCALCGTSWSSPRTRFPSVCLSILSFSTSPTTSTSSSIPWICRPSRRNSIRQEFDSEKLNN